MTHQESHRVSGFTYVGVLILMAIIGIIAAATADVWRTERKREAETELLFIGNQFREAIRRYYDLSPARLKSFPHSLQDLLRDPRTPGTTRYLRKIYVDPMTGTDDWGLVKGPSGEIVGVFSQSDDEPLKKGNFRRADEKLQGKLKYSEWAFIYTPSSSSFPSAAVAPTQRTTGGPRVPH